MKIGFLTEEQAAPIRRQWLRKAKGELIFWAIGSALAYAFCRDWLAGYGWNAFTWVQIIGFSLLLFSRLAIWAGLITIFTVGWFFESYPWVNILWTGLCLAITWRALWWCFRLLNRHAPPLTPHGARHVPTVFHTDAYQSHDPNDLLG